MEAAHQIYCEFQFLEEFYSSMGIMDQMHEEFDRRYEIRKLIESRSDLYLNVSKERFSQLAKGNKFLELLCKNSTYAGSRIHDFSDDFGSLNRDDYLETLTWLHKLYLHCGDDQRCTHLWRNIPVVNSNNEAIAELWKDALLIKEAHVSSNQTLNQFSDWSILREIGLPITDIVVADIHILKKKEELEINLLKLFDNLLDNVEITKRLKVLLFVERDSLSFAALESRIRVLDDYFERRGLSNGHQIGIREVSKDDIHDRHIITNYLWIRSGHSFDYFNLNGKIKRNKNTTLTIKGIAQWREAEMGMLGQLALLKESKLHGVDENRILR